MKFVNFGGDIKGGAIAGGANFSESTTEHKATVPTGKRWYFFGGLVNRDANATIVVRIKDGSDNPLIELLNKAAGTGLNNIPDDGMAIYGLVPMKEGWYIHFNFGAAQGAGAKIAAIVLEVSA